jgi:hypothetical protein
MSTVKTKNVQIGDSLTATNNFTLYQPLSPDGTLRLGNGNSGSVTDAVTLTSAGNVGVGTSSPSRLLSVSGSAQGVATFQSTSATRGFVTFQDANTTNDAQVGVGAVGNNLVLLAGGAAERMRIDSSGNLLVGTTTAVNSSNTILKGTGTADLQLTIGAAAAHPGVAFHYGNTSTLPNAANSVIKLGLMASTSRSISAAGTINASGADYAEYMTKAGAFTLAKGDVVGINAEGKLTNVFDDAVSFCVKSTDPSYVGGDVWGCGFDNDPEGLEVARQCVDRIAFAGQVPVNVTGATPGQFIIPVNENGSIKGEAVSNPTFEQYQIAVGKVIAIEADGRARIIVKVA